VDVALKVYNILKNGLLHFVSILVFVDVALKEKCYIIVAKQNEKVSILVFVDVALKGWLGWQVRQ